MNYMKQVAEMLGVELGEEFMISDCPKNFRYRITHKGLEVFSIVIEDDKWEKIKIDLLDQLLVGRNKIIKLPKFILSEKEKKYLSDFIDPFKSQVTYIEKHYLKDFKGNEKEFISIGIKENEKYWRQMELPLYDAGKYYKGMNTSEHYTLEELGL